MKNTLKEIKTEVYDRYHFDLSDFQFETESKIYEACRFYLNKKKIIGRTAKRTPKKIGQFVTFWKRKENQVIEPFEEQDEFDFLVINVNSNNKLGQFVFPKSVLIDKGIVSSKQKSGKRAFRVYSKWDKPESKQAKYTQSWQIKYFIEINASTNLDEVITLYKGV